MKIIWLPAGIYAREGNGIGIACNVKADRKRKQVAVPKKEFSMLAQLILLSVSISCNPDRDKSRSEMNTSRNTRKSDCSLSIVKWVFVLTNKIK